MKTKHKELLLEMINLSEKKETVTNYLELALDKMGGFTEGISSINKILRWLNPFWAKVHEYDLERIDIYTEGVNNDYIVNNMKKLFKYCQELNEILVLEEKYVSYNKNLTHSEIKELREFVEENTEKKLGSIYIRKT